MQPQSDNTEAKITWGLQDGALICRALAKTALMWGLSQDAGMVEPLSVAVWNLSLHVASPPVSRGGDDGGLLQQDVTMDFSHHQSLQQGIKHGGYGLPKAEAARPS